MLPVLGAGRRVVLFDFLGFGMSSKPDHRYSLLTQADLAAPWWPTSVWTGSTC